MVARDGKKMHVGLTLLFASALAGVAGVGACTTDAPSTDPTAAQGERSGPCYPNGTCNDGLVCDDVSNRCVRPKGEQDAAPVDGPDASDAGQPGDPEPDAGSACEVTIPPLDPNGFRCPNGARCDVGCCAGPSSATCSELACEDDQAAFQCEAPDTCYDGVSVCCGDLTPRAGSCSNAYDVLPQTRVRCRPACEQGEKPLCRTAADCPNGLRCEPSRLFLAQNPTAMEVGVCVP